MVSGESKLLFFFLIVFLYTVSILQVISWLKTVAGAPAIAFTFSPIEREKDKKGGRTPFFHVHLYLFGQNVVMFSYV